MIVRHLQYVSLFDSGEYDGDEQEREGQVQQEGVDERLRAVHFRVELGHAFYLQNKLLLPRIQKQKV